MRDKDERSEHHWEIPIIYSTRGAAFIFHHPRLERAEKQNADHIADGIRQGDKHQNTDVDQSCKIEHTDDSVQCYPA